METIKDKIIAKQDEYIAYLTKAIKSESIIEAITAGVRSSYESELSRLKDEGEEREPLTSTEEAEQTLKDIRKHSAEQSDKLTAEEGQKIASWLFERARKEIPDLTWENFYTVDFTLGASWVIDLIGEYASQFVGEKVTDMRKELITFLKEYHKSMFVIDLENSKIDYEEVINEYLKTR